MKKYLTMIVLTSLLAACTPTPTTAPATAKSNEPVTNSITPSSQDVIPVPPTQPIETAIAAPDTPGSLWLQVLSPQEDAIVNTAQIDVIGSAPAGAVVSINDEVILILDDGQFEATVSLEEGPNLIEVIASDTGGNETSLLITVTYEP